MGSRRATRAVSSVASSMEQGVMALVERGSQKFGAWGMTVTMYSFQISGAVVVLPFAYAALGWAFALIVQFGWLGCNFLVAKLTDDVIQRTQGKQEEHNRVRTLGDVGGALYGRPGRIIATTMQTAVMFAVILVELDLAGQTLQYLASYPFNCLGYWSLIAWVRVDLDRRRRASLARSLALRASLVLQAAFMLVLIFVRRFKENLWFASISSLVGSVKGLILLPIAYALYRGDIQASVDYVGPTKAFFSSTSWYEISQAVALIVLASQPIVIQAEVTEDLVEEQRGRALRATNTAIVMYGILYTTAGLTGSLMLGYGATTAPITTALPRTGLTLAINALVLWSTIADFLISTSWSRHRHDDRRALTRPTLSLSQSRATRFARSPGSLIFNSWVRRVLDLRPPMRFYYILGMLPSGILGLVIVLCVPNFAVLASITTAFCACGQQSFLTTMSWWLGDWRKVSKHASPAWLGGSYRVMTIVGAALTAFLIAGSIEGFISAYITSDSIPSFFCQATP